MTKCKQFLKCNRLALLGFTAAFLTLAAFSLLYASDTWAQDISRIEYYQY